MYSYLGPPDPPSNVMVTNRNTTSVGLSWNTGFNGNSPLVNVIISYESPNYPLDGTQYVLLPLVFSTTLTMLRPNANYSIHIALVNSAGFSSSYITVQASTFAFCESIAAINNLHGPTYIPILGSLRKLIILLSYLYFQ